jgi:ferredoxin
MAGKTSRLPGNVPGRWYVDDGCIGCNLCVDLYPDIFAMNDADNLAFVKMQPRNPKEEEEARDAATQCPVESIHEEEPVA